MSGLHLRAISHAYGTQPRAERGIGVRSPGGAGVPVGAKRLREDDTLLQAGRRAGRPADRCQVEIDGRVVADGAHAKRTLPPEQRGRRPDVPGLRPVPAL